LDWQARHPGDWNTAPIKAAHGTESRLCAFLDRLSLAFRLPKIQRYAHNEGSGEN